MPRVANPPTTDSVVRDAVRSAISPRARLVLAVSGGRDSMVLLDAVARWRPGSIAAVATFDHGTGDAARVAVDLVRGAAGLLGAPFACGRGRALPPTEASWRRARWSFLRETAETLDARVATAHTRDDQLETVFIRALRDAGPRGLAGLYAESDVVRPLIDITRDVVAHYAAARDMPVADDPSNRSRRHLRNRVRMDLLPAFERLAPGFGDRLLNISRVAARWRADVERYVSGLQIRREGDSVFVTRDAFADQSEHGAALIWPALAARVGVVLDRRGTARLAAFSTRGQSRGPVPLSGGHTVVRHAGAFEIRRSREPSSEAHRLD